MPEVIAEMELVNAALKQGRKTPETRWMVLARQHAEQLLAEIGSRQGRLIDGGRAYPYSRRGDDSPAA